MLTGSSPILAALDVAETVRFYKDVLGFSSSWTWGEPVSFGGASWGKITIMFSYRPDLVGQIDGHEHWFDVDDVSSLYAMHLERGAKIISAIDDKPWGRREYTVCDPNGYHLRFAGDPTHTPRGAISMPAGVSIVRRLPSEEEFTKVTGNSFDRIGGPSEILSRAWSSVLAISPTGEVIGVVRVMYDAAGWFSIWDVAVLPDWQGQRIGTAMMEAALALVREESPGAFVYLFTHKHAFYERIGFTTGSVDMIQV